MFHRRMLLVAVPLLFAAPTRAEYVHTTYSGSVAETAANSPVAVGMPITFDLVYDPAKFVDYTAQINSAYGSNFSSLEANSLADDPGASLTIRVGGITLTKFDQLRYGTPYSDCDPGDCGPGGLGIGNFPAAIMIDGALSGVGNIFVNPDGYSLDADPIANYLISGGTGGGFGLDGAGSGTFSFYLGHAGVSSSGEIDAFHQGLAVGNIDMGTVETAAVPEPASWAMMICGLGLVGAAVRTGRCRNLVLR